MLVILSEMSLSCNDSAIEELDMTWLLDESDVT